MNTTAVVYTLVSAMSREVAPDQRLFDISAASVRLGCSERYLRRLIQERRIPFVKLGGTKIRFQSSDLDRWVESQVVEAKR